MEFRRCICEFPKEVGLVYQVSRLRPIENKGPEEDLMEEDGLFATTLLETVCRLVKVCDQLSMYPLHAACQDTDKPVTARFPSSFVIGMLLRAGADVNSKDHNGMFQFSSMKFAEINNQHYAGIIRSSFWNSM